MLIIVDAAGSYATANIGESTPNTLMSYNGVSDPDITSVDAYDYTITRADPPSMDDPEYAYVPFFFNNSSEGWTTGVRTICTRNLSDWPHSPSYPVYTVHPWDQNGWELGDVSANPPTPWSGPLIPASTPLLVGEGVNTCGNFCVICPQNSYPYATISNGNDDEGMPGIPGNPPGEYVEPQPPVLRIEVVSAYLPVNGAFQLTATIDGEPVVCDWTIEDANGSSVTIDGATTYMNGYYWRMGASQVTLFTGPNPCYNLNGVKIYARVSNTSHMPPGVEYPSEEQEYALTIYKINLKYVTFYAQNNDDCHEVWKDDGTGPYAPYPTSQWHDASNPLDGDADDPGDAKYPICYTRDKKMKVTVSLATQPPVTFYQPKIIGMGPDGMEFPLTAATVQNGVFTASGIEAETSLPDTVKYYESFDIDWNLSPSGTTYYYAGTSDNTVYVTLDNPVEGMTLYETVVDIGCRNARDLSSPVDVFNTIWADFQPDADGIPRVWRARDDHNNPDLAMKYWGEYASWEDPVTHQPHADAFTTAGLVKNADGRCGAWRAFFDDCLRAQGDDSGIRVRVIPLDSIGAIGFLVKNWQFNGRDKPPTALYGIPGQGNPDPYSAFGDHALLYYGGQFYDPSYGLGPYSILDRWEHAAISIVTYGDPVWYGEEQEATRETDIIIPVPKQP